MKPTNLSKCPPPRKFRPAGLLQLVELADQGPRPLIHKKRRYTPTQRIGVGFERKIQANFFEQYENYIPSPWLHFQEKAGNRWRWCQPDGFFIDLDAGRITVVEVKLRHTSDAWWQVRRLYEPVLSFLFGPHWAFSALEVVRWYDGTVAFPESYVMAPDPRGVANGRFGVHIAGN